MIDMEEFKGQLLTFIEFMGEPIDADSIYRQCIQPVERYRIYEVLYQLEDEGKVLRLSDGRYIAAKSAFKRWVRDRLIDVKVPEDIVKDAKQVMGRMPGRYKNIDSFISEAIREYVERVWSEWYKRGGSRGRGPQS